MDQFEKSYKAAKNSCGLTTIRIQPVLDTERRVQESTAIYAAINGGLPSCGLSPVYLSNGNGTLCAQHLDVVLCADDPRKLLVNCDFLGARG
jgi:hypothetical protein